MAHHKRKHSKYVRAGKKKRPWKLGFQDYDGNCRKCKTSDAQREDAAEYSELEYYEGSGDEIQV